MQQIDVLSDDARQAVSFPLPDGTDISFVFTYRPGIQRWSMDLSHPLLTLNGYNLCVHPNLLRPWKNLISFGIAILSSTGLDPMNATDFLDGTCTINILSADEVEQVETEVLAPIALDYP